MLTAKVFARPNWNDICPVQAGKTYELLASGTWWDWFVPSGPGGYEGTILKPVAHLKRSPADRWFCLMGAVDQDEDTLFPIGSHKTWTSTQDGILCCVANDIPAMHWNNWGAVTVSVRTVWHPVTTGVEFQQRR
ncbi:hypothetical protein ELG77_33080 (plasmid) [Rhizobium leguminosarum]|uniref:hypothetical protein n=1 Tax=Rhizobium leguminosarum TaxID=384 RepID=UPI001031405C|nr:hypothetical protein [Rhizobium leguminosarum]TBF23407.1 hypothetical protein ELG92_34185 [Rhizobium leguminosarum]TBG29501.1 hypothetical protein ELG77_33080 [Rhizobium leguminosarum]